jgi:hypothetical protein
VVSVPRLPATWLYPALLRCLQRQSSLILPCLLSELRQKLCSRVQVWLSSKVSASIKSPWLTGFVI